MVLMLLLATGFGAIGYPELATIVAVCGRKKQCSIGIGKRTRRGIYGVCKNIFNQIGYTRLVKGFGRFWVI